MNRHDIDAGNLYAEQNLESFGLAQQMRFWRDHHPIQSVRELIKSSFDESELAAKIQMVAPWFVPNDKRSEARLAAFLASRFCINWWRELATAEEKLGVADELFQQRVIEPILNRLAMREDDSVTALLQSRPKQPPTDHVTLMQCAAIIKKSKRTLERWKQNDTAFPTPEIIGDDGGADEWSWATIKPYLEIKARRELPEIFPAHVER